MKYTEMPQFMTALALENGSSARALEFLILTATRTNEVLQATWDEIHDLEAGIWIIPAKRMKMRREHLVPLSTQAIMLLERQQLSRPAHNNYLFPGAIKRKPLSNMALLQRMRRMGYGVNGTMGDYVPHGFRSSFCDWANEESYAPHHVVEMALAHTIRNKTEAAYRRGVLFKKRCILMQEWADHLYPQGYMTPDKRS